MASRSQTGATSPSPGMEAFSCQESRRAADSQQGVAHDLLNLPRSPLLSVLSLAAASLPNDRGWLLLGFLGLRPLL